jgi:hypothetical protein
VKKKTFQTCWSAAGPKIFFLGPKKNFFCKKKRVPTSLVVGGNQNFLFLRGMADRLDILYPRNFFDAVRLGLEYVEQCRGDEGVSKNDALDGVESRLSFMMSKVLAAPTATSYSVFRGD